MLTEEISKGKNLIQLINDGDKQLQSYCQNVLNEILRIWGRLFDWVKVENCAEKINELLDISEIVYSLELPDERENFITSSMAYLRQKFYEAKKQIKFLSNKENTEKPFVGENQIFHDVS